MSSRQNHPPPPPVPQVLHKSSKDGKVSYVIGKRMGSGGFGTVYAGEELPSHRKIAIKCIPKTRIADPRVKEKLISEVDIQKSLHNEHVVEFLGVFQDDNYVYILLELCPNGTVLDQLRKHMPFTEDQAANVARQVLLALVYLHENRVIHRDLKLQNFLLDENMNVKIADFGLSAKLEDEDDKRMTICGTPSYLSPEVLDHHEGQTYLVDVWALGVCTFLMLTGKQPFQSKDKHSTYKRIQHVDYKWPSEPKLSAAAMEFVDLALKRDPAERPSAAKLLEHPFILRQDIPEKSLSQLPEKSRSRSRVVTPKEEGVRQTLPPYSVRIWWDYSHRYGLAYLLRNSVCGACFNDFSRILLTPDETLAQYWETPQTQKPEIVSLVSINESPLKKKLLLIKHFATELKHRVGEIEAPPLKINMPTDVIAHVKYWARTKEGILFRMANRDIQANFKDHTKLVIESQTKKMFYDTGECVKVLALSDLSDREHNHDVRKRFVLVKEMAKQLV